MLIEQPLAFFSVITPEIDSWLTCSNDVQVELYLSEQPPLELQVIPAPLNCEVAEECEIFVWAYAGALTPNTVLAAANRPTSRYAYRCQFSC